MLRTRLFDPLDRRREFLVRRGYISLWGGRWGIRMSCGDSLNAGTSSCSSGRMILCVETRPLVMGL